MATLVNPMKSVSKFFIRGSFTDRRTSFNRSTTLSIMNIIVSNILICDYVRSDQEGLSLPPFLEVYEPLIYSLSIGYLLQT